MRHTTLYSAVLAASVALAFSVPAAAHGDRHSHAHGGSRHYSGGAHHGHYGPRHRAYRHGYYAGAPLIASDYYYAPRYYVPRYPRVAYYCPAYAAYYPRVHVCPMPWQQVVRHAAVPALPTPVPYYYPG